MKSQAKLILPMVLPMVLALAACAYTSSEVVKQNSRFQFTSTNKPQLVAKCVVRNADEVDPSQQSQLRDGEVIGSYEVIVRIIGASVSTLAVLKIDPAKQGSLINTYLSHNVIVDHRTFAQKLLKGC